MAISSRLNVYTIPYRRMEMLILRMNEMRRI